MINTRLVFVLAVGCVLMSCRSSHTEQETRIGPGALVLEFRPDSVVSFPPVSGDSIIVFEWLRAVADSAKLAFDYTEFSIGILVEQIGPKRNGEGGNWLYQVNGEKIPKSCSNYRVAPSDTVTFIYNE